MITIKSLGSTSVKIIYQAFLNAFSDYVEELSTSYEQFKYMIERRGCNLELSFGAFTDDRLVGFTLNAVGMWNQKLTAYDTGTGIIQEFRKKGIATQIFNEMLPLLRQQNISQYLLEVIRTNKAAFSLYQKAGFRVTREFNYYRSLLNELTFKNKEERNEHSLRILMKYDWEELKPFWDFNPSWQNSIDSITRKMKHFTFLGMFEKNYLLGYGIIENHSGDIPHFAISKNYRRKGLATALLKNLVGFSKNKSINVINTDADYKPFNQFAGSVNLTPGPGQYEMAMDL